MKKYILILLLLLVGTSYAASVITSGANIQDNTITSAKIQDNTITSAKMVDNTIEIGKLGGSGARDNTTSLRGDGAWGKVIPTVCNLSKSDNQAFTATIGAAITWDVEDSDLLNAHSASDNTIITIPSGYTWANFYASTYFGVTAAAESNKVLYLYKNGAALNINSRVNQTPNYAASNLIVSGWIPVIAGDNVSVRATSSDNATLQATSAYFRAEFK